jgi:prepilin-type N-terminal cleavage/methylation domain-containing protein
MNISRTHKRTAAGFTLLEVLIGMVIFALGMMALAQLQGNLSKSSADSNARSVALNIAEETIEAARTFVQVPASSDVSAFENIVSGSTTESRGGISYDVVQTVTNYYYHAPATVNGNPTFTTEKPANAGNPDMKLLQLAVSWGSGQKFQIDETQENSTLGSGSITLTDVISSITSPSGSKVVLNSTTSELYGPPVDYNPGQRPDIVSIQLGANRFKESTTPLPDVIRSGELAETKFDVVTYSQNDAGATFLRREEFRAVSCSCTLRIPGGATEGGLRPTLWNGNDYTEGEFVSKPYGESANNQQSVFCSLCCNDHHDGGSGAKDDANDPGSSRYDPFRDGEDYWKLGDPVNSGLVGDHKHYNRNNSGGLSLVSSDGATYVEACRLVRKDGFFRVAQDLRQEGLNSFPANFLDDGTEVAKYSKYVTDAVSGFEATIGETNRYEDNPPVLTEPQNMSPAVSFPASTFETPTVMTASSSSQQLRSRGIYVDYLSDALRTIINCLDNGGTGPGCGAKGSNTALEVIPFYDVQLTWLTRWIETPTNNPIDVSNDAIQDGNTHSRGVARLTSGFGDSTINAKIYRGNPGLTGTDSVDPDNDNNVRDYDLFAVSTDGSTPAPDGGYLITGSITSSVGGVQAADVEIEAANGAQCDRTLTGFECIVPFAASNPRLTVSNYFKNNKVLLACSTMLSINGTDHSGTDPAQNWTRFNLPLTNLPNANIIIKQDFCN